MKEGLIQRIKMTEEELIQSIPRFECSEGSPLELDDNFLKGKLLNAIANRDIICLARGEGRSRALNDIVFHPEILFDWGEKSLHAFLEKKDERLRNFCDPGIVDKEVMIYYIEKYGENLKCFYERYVCLGRQESDVNTFMEQLIYIIRMETDNAKLLCIKDWLLYALHTMQEKEFSRITPCISCSYGDRRFDVAYKFGKGHYNNYFVVMDCWVERSEEGRSYKRADYVNKILSEYGLTWFPNRHNEIMLKYGIFPQQLVGYYFWDRGSLKKYVINKHYIDAWKENAAFEIGDPIYFEQTIDFEKLGPYNTVYEYNGRCFSIAGRRN